MTQRIEDLVQFYAQKFHVPLTLFTDSWQVENWDKQGIAIVLPSDAENARAITKLLPGDLVVVNDTPVARISKQWLVLFMWANDPESAMQVRTFIDHKLPRLCRQYRHEMRGALVTSVAECVKDRKRELQSSIREDAYELERLSLQMIQLSRKLETDRQVMKMFERAPEWIKARATRTFVDLMKLVPVTYASFSIEDHTITGVTHPVDIEHDGCSYHFDAYEVEADLRQGKVRITGGTESNGYIHPHVTDGDNICWGNIGGLVSRLIGELDLFGLFQLVHQFLTTYNESDPFQKIEKWDPGWVDDDEEPEPYCSWCDDYGHEIEDCDQCWWCEYCQQYDDHDEENCPNRPKEESEDAHAVAEEQAA